MSQQAAFKHILTVGDYADRYRVASCNAAVGVAGLPRPLSTVFSRLAPQSLHFCLVERTQQSSGASRDDGASGRLEGGGTPQHVYPQPAWKEEDRLLHHSWE